MSEIERLRHENAAMRSALEPLAEIPRKLRVFGKLPISSIKVNVGIGLLDRAREVLDNLGQGDQS